MRKIEDEFPGTLQVVGIHSAKFDREKTPAGIRAAIERHGVRHPVANDERFTIWRSYAVRAWPTIVVIDPNGRIAAQEAGEVPYAALSEFLRKAIAQFDAAGSLRASPALVTDSKQRSIARSASGLRFPGKVLAAGERLFIADTGNHRVLVARREAAPAIDVSMQIGSGEPGRDDGPLGEARFLAPQGMALRGHELYVADCEAHTIRKIDLAAGIVTTIAGTGEQGWGPLLRPARGGYTNPPPFGIARETPIASPWDLVSNNGGILLAALAGSHQIARIDLESGLISPFAGNGSLIATGCTYEFIPP